MQQTRRALLRQPAPPASMPTFLACWSLERLLVTYHLPSQLEPATGDAPSPVTPVSKHLPGAQLLFLYFHFPFH